MLLTKYISLSSFPVGKRNIPVNKQILMPTWSRCQNDPIKTVTKFQTEIYYCIIMSKKALTKNSSGSKSKLFFSTGKADRHQWTKWNGTVKAKQSKEKISIALSLMQSEQAVKSKFTLKVSFPSFSRWCCIWPWSTWLTPLLPNERSGHL